MRTGKPVPEDVWLVSVQAESWPHRDARILIPGACPVFGYWQRGIPVPNHHTLRLVIWIIKWSSAIDVITVFKCGRGRRKSQRQSEKEL